MALNAHLHLTAAKQLGKTYLQTSYCTPPFKIANITENTRQPFLELMVMSSSPGILDGDVYDWQIRVAEGACLHLQTQSYQRIFQMDASATQRSKIYLANDAQLVYLPHPVVPHSNSNFSATTNIYLLDNSVLLWGEIITCGRMLHNEVFQLTKYHSRLNIFFHEQLQIQENVCIQPNWAMPMSLGLLEGFTHQASIIYWNPQCNRSSLTQVLHSFLSNQQHCFGITQTNGFGLLIRLMGYKAEPLYALQQQLQNIIFQHQN